MHRSSLRLFGVGVPLAGITAVACGHSEAALAVFTYLLISVASLGAADAFRCAAGKQLSTRKVMGSLILALLLVALGTAGAIYALPDAMLMILCGGLLAAVRCTEELFASQGDLTSARVTDALSFIALSAALLIPGDTPLYCCIAAGGTLIVGGTIAAGFSRRELPQLNGAIFREIPFALLRTVLYPALFLDAVWMLKLDASDPAILCGFFAGLMLIELAKTAARRGKEESAGLKIGVSVGILLISLAVFALGCYWYGADLPMGVAALLLAAACALVMYAPVDWETIAAIVVMIAAVALTVIGISPDSGSFPLEIFIGPAAGIVLCLLMVRQWAQLFRQSRANRIRKRALKKSRS